MSVGMVANAKAIVLYLSSVKNYLLLLKLLLLKLHKKGNYYENYWLYCL